MRIVVDVLEEVDVNARTLPRAASASSSTPSNPAPSFGATGPPTVSTQSGQDGGVLIYCNGKQERAYRFADKFLLCACGALLRTVW